MTILRSGFPDEGGTMMDLNMFDQVLLKTGDTAFIVEIYDNSAAYEMDINTKDGKITTDTVWPDEIDRKL